MAAALSICAWSSPATGRGRGGGGGGAGGAGGGGAGGGVGGRSGFGRGGSRARGAPGQRAPARTQPARAGVWGTGDRWLGGGRAAGRYRRWRPTPPRSGRPRVRRHVGGGGQHVGHGSYGVDGGSRGWSPGSGRVSGRTEMPGTRGRVLGGISVGWLTTDQAA